MNKNDYPISNRVARLKKLIRNSNYPEYYKKLGTVETLKM